MLLFLLGCVWLSILHSSGLTPLSPCPGVLAEAQMGARCLLGPGPGMQFETFPSLFSG